MPRSKDNLPKRKSKTGKFIFTLKNINSDKIDKMYGIELKSNIEIFEEDIFPENITKINDLANINDKISFSYLDEAKKTHKCVVTMINDRSVLGPQTNLNCFWCRHSFTTHPIGCPLKYIPSELVKTYYSEITKDKYKIRENISKRKRSKLSNDNDLVNIEEKEYYKTDGIFCSFNCCLAFIKDNNDIPMYSLSRTLLAGIYKKIFNICEFNIEHAPSWRLLETYGGDLTIEEFRKKFNKVEYNIINEDYICNPVNCCPVGFLFEERVKF